MKKDLSLKIRYDKNAKVRSKIYAPGTQYLELSTFIFGFKSGFLTPISPHFNPLFILDSSTKSGLKMKVSRMLKSHDVITKRLLLITILDWQIGNIQNTRRPQKFRITKYAQLPPNLKLAHLGDILHLNLNIILD